MMRTDPLKLDTLRLHVETTGLTMHVQIKRTGCTLCGVVRDAFEARDGRGVYQVSTILGTGWFPESHVRQCSGVDGRCECAGEDQPGAAARGGRGTSTARDGAQGVPLGNTGTTADQEGASA